MAPITTTIQVERSADDVFAYATDPTRFSEWQQGVTGGHMEDGTPAVGTGATQPDASAARTDPASPKSPTSTHPRAGAYEASTDRSGPSSTSPCNP